MQDWELVKTCGKQLDKDEIVYNLKNKKKLLRNFINVDIILGLGLFLIYQIFLQIICCFDTIAKVAISKLQLEIKYCLKIMP